MNAATFLRPFRPCEDLPPMYFELGISKSNIVYYTVLHIQIKGLKVLFTLRLKERHSKPFPSVSQHMGGIQ